MSWPSYAAAASLTSNKWTVLLRDNESNPSVLCKRSFLSQEEVNALLNGGNNEEIKGIIQQKLPSDWIYDYPLIVRQPPILPPHQDAFPGVNLIIFLQNSNADNQTTFRICKKTRTTSIESLSTAGTRTGEQECVTDTTDRVNCFQDASPGDAVIYSTDVWHEVHTNDQKVKRAMLLIDSDNPCCRLSCR